MISFLNLSKKKFAIYGLGQTGLSVIQYLKKKGANNLIVWDDYKSKQKITLKDFALKLDEVDFIVISPGININKSKFKKNLKKNKKKIITDLDIFYLTNKNVKSIVVTGTNGKSTTCKVIEHILKKNRINAKLGGNIGKPILTLNFKKNTVVIIEASSFQLALSKFIKPKYAIILNVTKDHLDWHGTMSNYFNSKMKIFSLQKNNDFAIFNNLKIFKYFKRNRYLSKIKSVSLKKYKKLNIKVTNKYLNSAANLENMSFAYEVSKLFKIDKKSFFNSIKSFKGLPHRQEVFYKKNNFTFIDDSKATSFESAKYALKSNKNIFWIVGGLPKIKDNFYFDGFKKNIIKAIIIGNHPKYFKNQLKNYIKFSVSKNIKSSLIKIFKKIRKINNKKINILLSPASASYDQYKNFGERGNDFKKLVKIYANKYI